MGLAPEKASRIKARDTQTTWPDPWSIQPGVVWEFVASTKTASAHLYWGLPNGPGISEPQASGFKLDSWSGIV